QDRFTCTPITVDTTGAHRLSRPSRPRVTVIEFIDHQCGHCAQAQATIEVKGGKAQIALPSACYSDRTFSVDRAGVVTLGVSAGC
ncbi:MAG TPA: hypothetical protein PKA64_22795, partial [Myxococcota bacterium]|nr:hypothetical protein [Myxococcota bacterium]